MCSGVKAGWRNRNEGQWERNEKASLLHMMIYKNLSSMKVSVLLTHLPIPVLSHFSPEGSTVIILKYLFSEFFFFFF